MIDEGSDYVDQLDNPSTPLITSNRGLTEYNTRRVELILILGTYCLASSLP